MNWWVERAREDVRQMASYTPAIWDKSLERLNANENPWRPWGDTTAAGQNHYPEPYPSAIAQLLARLYRVNENQLVVTRGADEAIDIVIRAYVNARQDAVMICTPTFGMYEFATKVQGGLIQKVSLTTEYQLDLAGIEARLTENTKLIMLCSPNNPTGNIINSIDIEAVLKIAESKALVVVDEAYIDFAATPPLDSWLPRYPGLVLLRTLSKSHSLAGARCGGVIGHPEVIDLIKRMLPPYSMSVNSMEAIQVALTAEGLQIAQERIEWLKRERARMMHSLKTGTLIKRILPSQANFIAVLSDNPVRLCEVSKQTGILIRNFDAPGLTQGLVRITVGTSEQNNRLIGAINRE